MANKGKKQDLVDLENLIKQIEERQIKVIKEVCEKSAKALGEIRLCWAEFLCNVMVWQFNHNNK